MDDHLSALAAALGELHRAPGNSPAWLSRVLHSLNRNRPDSYDSLRRRIGLSRRLADLAELPDKDAAVVTLGLLFHVVLGRLSSEPVPKPRRNWLEYLEREAWLNPPLELAQSVVGQTQSDSFATAFARAVVVVDTAAHGRRLKPLQVIQSLREDAETASELRVAELLATEGGQELCDVHVRSRGEHYVLESGEMKAAAELLQKVAPSSPRRDVGPAGRVGRTRPGPEAAWSDLERRRKDLQAAAGAADQGDPKPTTTEQSAMAKQKRDRPADHDEVQDRKLFSMVKSGGTVDIDDALPTESEEAPMQNRQPSNAEATHDVERTLDELRQRLFQIGQATAEAQELLTTLAPQMEELSSWMSDLDTIVERWKGRGAKAV